MLITAVQQSDCYTYIYIYILFHILFHYGLSQDIEYSSSFHFCLGLSPERIFSPARSKGWYTWHHSGCPAGQQGEGETNPSIFCHSHLCLRGEDGIHLCCVLGLEIGWQIAAKWIFNQKCQWPGFLKSWVSLWIWLSFRTNPVTPLWVSGSLLFSPDIYWVLTVHEG